MKYFPRVTENVYKKIIIVIIEPYREVWVSSSSGPGINQLFSTTQWS